jgi:hypothetical protein
MLHVYVSSHCIGCDTARRLADRIRIQCPDIPVLVVDVDQPEAEVPAKIFGTPMYTWDDHVLFLGNPSEVELMERIGVLYGGAG